MRRLFGGAKQPTQPPVSLNDATQKVDDRVKTLDEKIKRLDTELIGYREKLKKTRPGPARQSLQQKAMQVLKQKKMYEGQRDMFMNQAFNMEQANFASQTMQDTVTTVNAMKTANTAMKQQFKEFNMDEIEEMQDDMADLMDMNNEIQETLGRSYLTPEVDESELEDELAALGEEIESEMTSNPSYLDSLPALPQTNPGQKSNVPLTN